MYVYQYFVISIWCVPATSGAVAKAASKENYESESQFVAQFYKDDINLPILEAQLELFSEYLQKFDH